MAGAALPMHSDVMRYLGLCAARSRLCVLFALALLAGCDGPPDGDVGEALELAAPAGAAHGGYAGGTDYAAGADKCCYALCQGAGAYIQTGNDKQTCPQDAAQFCAEWQSVDPAIGPLVDHRWLYC